MDHLAHIIDPDSTERWQAQDWGGYSIELKAMTYDVDTTRVVRSHG